MIFKKRDTTKVYRNGQIVLPQGNHAKVMGLVEAGRVEVFHKSEDGEETVYRVLGPNESFGVDTLFNNRPRHSGVRALGKATVSIMDRRDFIRYAQAEPMLACTILKTICRRISEIDEEMRQKNGDLSNLDSPPDNPQQIVGD